MRIFLTVSVIFILIMPSALAGYDYLLAVSGGLGLATRKNGPFLRSTCSELAHRKRRQ